MEDGTMAQQRKLLELVHQRVHIALFWLILARDLKISVFDEADMRKKKTCIVFDLMTLNL